MQIAKLFHQYPDLDMIDINCFHYSKCLYIVKLYVDIDIYIKGTVS